MGYISAVVRSFTYERVYFLCFRVCECVCVCVCVCVFVVCILFSYLLDSATCSAERDKKDIYVFGTNAARRR